MIGLDEMLDRYNCETCHPLTLSEYWHFNGGPKPGELAPDFDLPTITGDWFRLSDYRGDWPVFFEFGSFTSPVAASARASMRKLFAEFGDHVWFLSIYAREAHPQGDHPRHATFCQKMRHAEEWADRDRITWTVAADWLEGRTHRAYGSLPNLAYLIDRTGHVAFRTLWAGQEGLLRRMLRKLLRLQSKTNGPIDLGENRSFLVPYLLGRAQFGQSKGSKNSGSNHGASRFGLCTLARALSRLAA